MGAQAHGPSWPKAKRVGLEVPLEDFFSVLWFGGGVRSEDWAFLLVWHGQAQWLSGSVGPRQTLQRVMPARAQSLVCSGRRGQELLLLSACRHAPKVGKFSGNQRGTPPLCVPAGEPGKEREKGWEGRKGWQASGCGPEGQRAAGMEWAGLRRNARRQNVRIFFASFPFGQARGMMAAVVGLERGRWYTFVVKESEGKGMDEAGRYQSQPSSAERIGRRRFCLSAGRSQ